MPRFGTVRNEATAPDEFGDLTEAVTIQRSRVVVTSLYGIRTIGSTTARAEERPDTMRLLSPAELAHQLNIARVTLYRWRRDRGLPFVKVGNAVRFDPAQVADWLASQSQ